MGMRFSRVFVSSFALLLALVSTACTSSKTDSPSGASGNVGPQVTDRYYPGVKSEGTVDGGGGKGVMCGTRLITLDRFEAERDFGTAAIQLDSSSLDAALLDMGERFGRQTATEALVPKEQWSAQGRAVVLKEWRGLVGDKLRPISAGTRLKPTADATLPSLASDCSFVQIAIYDANGVIHYDPEYWSMLDPIDVAVLYAHEYYYSQFRKYGVTTSDGTRQMIGLALAGKLKPMFEPLWTKSRFLLCFGGGLGGGNQVFEFYLIDDGPTNLKSYFRALGTEYVYTETSGIIPGLDSQTFMSSNWKSKSFQAEEDVFGGKWIVEIEPNLNRTPAPGENEILLRAYRQGGAVPSMQVGHCHYQNQKPPSAP